MAEPLTLAVIAILVFLVSFTFANVGLGGGGLYVPILLLLYVDNDDIVVPISLTLAMATAIASAYNHGRRGFVDFRIGERLVAGALVGAVLGTVFTLDFLLDVRDFKIFFAGLLLVLAVLLLIDWRRGRDLEEDTPVKETRGRLGAASVATAASGFISGSAGVGGGVFNVPILTYILGRKTRTAVGTSSMIIIPTAIFGFLIFAARAGLPPEFVAIPILAPLALIGGYLGSRWGLRALRTRTVALLFIGVVFLADALVVLDVLGVV
ncbi:MAG TPA: sulfite exporter TauE/SafE family protein [Thermoplasmata archaeon]|nr:sulfite exporter TauE/SafE family protein [Thermoplasmata archaeon]